MESDSVSSVQENNITNSEITTEDPGKISTVECNDETQTLTPTLNADTEELNNDSKKPTVSLSMSPSLDDDIRKSSLPETHLESLKGNQVELYAKDEGPRIYDVKGNVVTPPIITKNLPKVFEYLPIFGRPDSALDLDEFYRSKIRDFVGCDLNDEEFSDLEKYCSPEHLKTGKEIVMSTRVPQPGLLTNNMDKQTVEQSREQSTLTDGSPEVQGPPNLYILKKFRLRMEHDKKGVFTKKLKYRGVRMIPHNMPEEEDVEIPGLLGTSVADEQLEPGRDIVYRIRVYRPYTYTTPKERFTRTRHSVFSCDIVLSGRQRLTTLRDRLVCHNDFDMRIDVADNPDLLPNTKAKDVFPSGFLFINNVFYVDSRSGCADCSAPLRRWAARRGLGRFPRRDLATVALDQLVLKLGHPDVYVHQGNCEHIFIFSEVRLLNPSDPLLLSQYPYSTAVGQNQSMYCTTCAEFCAKWIVVGCSRVPFDPAFFCESCLKQYLYKDGQKIGDFKAYSYRGNALNVLKPQ